jgi:hypothetical protein
MLLLPLLALAAAVSAQELPSPSAVLAQARAASRRPVLEGRFPEANFPGREEHIAAIWDFVQGLGGPKLDLEPPVIHFSRFVLAEQDPAFTAWQRQWSRGNEQIWTDYLCNAAGKKAHPEIVRERLCDSPEALRAWLAAHPEVREEYPYPPQFRAFHYDGTNRIQVDPYTTYMAFYQNGPDGLPRDYVGYGYYVTGHELLHYVLEQRGIPGPRHHCLFVTKQADGKSYMEKLAEFIVARGVGTDFSMKRYGLSQEESLNPCGAPRP